MMATYNPKTYRAILSDMENWVIANQDKITDFNEGSGITSLIEAIAQQIEQLYLRTKIGFIKYLPNLPFYAFGFSKHAGTKASGTVVFSRTTPTADMVTINIGTLVSTDTGLIFATTAQGVILPGATNSGEVPIQAYDIGANFNVPANTITTMTTPVVGVNSVTNPSSTTGGLDEEDDNSFQRRFRDYILGLGRGNVYGLRAAAMSVTGVRSASLIEHFPPLSDIYNISLYIDDGAGNAPQELIDAVSSVIYGDGTLSNPGYKPAGVNIRVLAPTKVTIGVQVRVTDTGVVSRTTMEQNIREAITNYINNLQIGEDVIYNELVQVIMGVVGVYDILLMQPSANISIGSTQIARVGTIDILYYN